MVKYLNLCGSHILPLIAQLAQLRVEVFREYPYLYSGSADYESQYLQHYAERASNLCVLAIDADKVVGASTAMWLRDAASEFSQCFADWEAALDNMFYFGESVLLPAYRGRGIGHQFFDRREQHALALGASITGFCAVDRPLDHPLRPHDYHPHDGFWHRRGYCHDPNRVAKLSWREWSGDRKVLHTLSFWLKHW